ncbi:MAG: hypothetical protein KGL53_04270, partial [Elusimicrobia bacterium]|nr:hypothetical protein [Elusimicrobiota bacterium]
MMKRTMMLLALAVAASPVAAEAIPKFNAGVFQTVGTDKYRGTDVYGAAGVAGFSIAPEFRHFQETGLGTHNLGMARLGWDTRYVGAGVNAGFMPKAAGSYAEWGGADVSFTLSPLGDTGIRRIGGPGRGGAPVGKGIARVDFGAGVTVTRHHTDAAVNVTQQEYHGFVGASVFDVLVSAQLSKFHYSRDLKAAGVTYAAPVWTPIGGHARWDNGYGDEALNLNVELPIFPMIRPYASYSFARYASLATGRPGDSKA